MVTIRSSDIHRTVAIRAADVDTTEAAKVKFATVIVVLVADQLAVSPLLCLLVESKPYVVINQWYLDPQPMLAGLKYCPIDSLFVPFVEARHQAQRISNTYSESLAANRPGTHRLKRVHNLNNPTLGRVARIELWVKRRSGGRNNIFVESEPVHVGASSCPWSTIQFELGALAVDVRISLQQYL